MNQASLNTAQRILEVGARALLGLYFIGPGIMKARWRHYLARLTSLRQIPLQREANVRRFVAQLQLDTTKVLANVVELPDQSLQGRATLKAQDLSRLSIQRRTMVLNIVDIDPDIHYIPAHRRLLIVYVADQPLEVSIDDGSPRVKKGASISSILGEVRVLLETVDGTAIAGSDYTTVRRELVFGNGISRFGVQIPLRADDAVPQPTREFFATLNIPTGGTGGANIDPFRATAGRIVDLRLHAPRLNRTVARSPSAPRYSHCPGSSLRGWTFRTQGSRRA